VVEPFVEKLPEALTSHGAKALSLDEAVAQQGILVLLVDHEIFRKVGEQQRGDAIVYDTRGIWAGAASAVTARQPQASAA
jgi:UDP-N-acetyl-D-mannosaminuronic acid dehydrogenase